MNNKEFAAYQAAMADMQKEYGVVLSDEDVAVLLSEGDAEEGVDLA